MSFRTKNGRKVRDGPRDATGVSSEAEKAFRGAAETPDERQSASERSPAFEDLILVIQQETRAEVTALRIQVQALEEHQRRLTTTVEFIVTDMQKFARPAQTETPAGSPADRRVGISAWILAVTLAAGTIYAYYR